jgi:hypothetical protein
MGGGELAEGKLGALAAASRVLLELERKTS